MVCSSAECVELSLKSLVSAVLSFKSLVSAVLSLKKSENKVQSYP
jgi:hypothetical protein